jgi:RNA polymerase sigma-70 factor, ECF subfamily
LTVTATIARDRRQIMGSAMDQHAEDRALLARIAAREQAALKALMVQHQVRVFRYLSRRLRNDAMAEDLTNEVFTEVWLHADKYEGRANASTWLVGIAHNRMVSKLRKRREEPLDEDKAGEIADTADGPEITAQKADKSRAIRSCIEKLSAAHREIVDLVYYHEMSITEISGQLGVPEATVKTRMFYARKQLSDILKTAGIDRGWP